MFEWRDPLLEVFQNGNVIFFWFFLREEVGGLEIFVNMQVMT